MNKWETDSVVTTSQHRNILISFTCLSVFRLDCRNVNLLKYTVTCQLTKKETCSTGYCLEVPPMYNSIINYFRRAEDELQSVEESYLTFLRGLSKKFPFFSVSSNETAPWSGDDEPQRLARCFVAQFCSMTMRLVYCSIRFAQLSVHFFYRVLQITTEILFYTVQSRHFPWK